MEKKQITYICPNAECLKKAEKSKDNCEIALCYDNFIITVPKNIRPKFGNTVSVNYARMTKLEI